MSARKGWSNCRVCWKGVPGYVSVVTDGDPCAVTPVSPLWIELPPGWLMRTFRLSDADRLDNGRQLITVTVCSATCAHEFSERGGFEAWRRAEFEHQRLCGYVMALKKTWSEETGRYTGNTPISLCDCPPRFPKEQWDEHNAAYGGKAGA